jgi:hypothetical protein
MRRWRRDDVLAATGRQQPYTYGSLPGGRDFLFHGGEVIEATAALPVNQAPHNFTGAATPSRRCRRSALHERHMTVARKTQRPGDFIRAAAPPLNMTCGRKMIH